MGISLNLEIHQFIGGKTGYWYRNFMRRVELDVFTFKSLKYSLILNKTFSYQKIKNKDYCIKDTAWDKTPNIINNGEAR